MEQGSEGKHFRDSERKLILSFREQGGKKPFMVSILNIAHEMFKCQTMCATSSQSNTSKNAAYAISPLPDSHRSDLHVQLLYMYFSTLSNRYTGKGIDNRGISSSGRALA